MIDGDGEGGEGRNLAASSLIYAQTHRSFYFFLQVSPPLPSSSSTSSKVTQYLLPQKLVRKTALYRFSLADMPHTFASFSRSFSRIRTRYVYASEHTLFHAADSFFR